eukprot:6961576-Prymnesium_polylepis.1
MCERAEVHELVGQGAEGASGTRTPGQKRRSYHVYYNGRWWQWSALVRALDGYVTQVDRGRHSRFWNGMAGWVQAEAARPEVRRAAAAAAA